MSDHISDATSIAPPSDSLFDFKSRRLKVPDRFLVEVCKLEMRNAKRRNQITSGANRASIVWEIDLYLYMHADDADLPTISSVCSEIDYPRSLTKRYIKLMEHIGMVEISSTGSDLESVVLLTNGAKVEVEHYLLDQCQS